jgi:hypothetical protein
VVAGKGEWDVAADADADGEHLVRGDGLAAMATE